MKTSYVQPLQTVRIKPQRMLGVWYITKKLIRLSSLSQDFIV